MKRGHQRRLRARPSRRPRRVDVVIIGAGVIGLFIAYHLHKRGLKRIVVLDKGGAGGVASLRSAGILRHHYSHPLLVEMAVLGRRAYAAFARESGFDVGYLQNGFLMVVGPDHAAALERNVRMHRDLGVRVTLLTAREIPRRFPQFRDPGRGTVGAYEREAGSVRPAGVVAALCQVLRAEGIEVREGQAATAVETSNGRVLAVRTARERWDTDVVVNCSGAWAAQVGRLAGVDLPVRVQRVLQIVEVPLPPGAADALPTLAHEPLDFYARPDRGGRVWIGGRRPLEPGTDPDTVSLLIDLPAARRVHDAYAGLVSFPLPGPATHGWAGIDGDTQDFQPILGGVGMLQGYYVAAGFSGHGFKLAPVVGLLVAEAVILRRWKTLDVSALHLDRFSAGQLFPPGYRQMGA